MPRAAHTGRKILPSAAALVDLFSAPSSGALALGVMRAVQITRFGGLEVLDIADVPEPTRGPGQQLYDVSTAGLNFADTTRHCPG